MTPLFPWLISERDHELQNPTSPEKIRLLGEYLRLGPESRVLDVACGKGGPARILAEAFGCRIVGIEKQPAFADEARSRAAASGLEALIEVETADAATVALEREAFDAALCLGAAFVWGTIADAAAALCPTVPPGGFVAVGEPYWRRLPLPEGVDDQGFVDLAGTVDRFEGAGLALTGIVAAADDDWDRYESLHWRATEEWLDANPGHPDAAELREVHERGRSDFVRIQRDLLGWAIFVGRRVA